MPRVHPEAVTAVRPRSAKRIRCGSRFPSVLSKGPQGGFRCWSHSAPIARNVLHLTTMKDSGGARGARSCRRLQVAMRPPVAWNEPRSVSMRREYWWVGVVGMGVLVLGPRPAQAWSDNGSASAVVTNTVSASGYPTQSWSCNAPVYQDDERSRPPVPRGHARESILDDTTGPFPGDEAVAAVRAANGDVQPGARGRNPDFVVPTTPSSRCCGSG